MQTLMPLSTSCRTALKAGWGGEISLNKLPRRIAKEEAKLPLAPKVGGELGPRSWGRARVGDGAGIRRGTRARRGAAKPAGSDH